LVAASHTMSRFSYFVLTRVPICGLLASDYPELKPASLDIKISDYPELKLAELDIKISDYPELKFASLDMTGMIVPLQSGLLPTLPESRVRGGYHVTIGYACNYRGVFSFVSARLIHKTSIT
jgi:hypothetical protein